MLLDRVGSPLSVRSIREDMEVSHQAVESWITLLENLYMVFRISPFGAPKIRAVKKEQKLYFYDWSSIHNKHIRFENMVAGHLLKYCHYHEDVKGEDMELRFLRDTDKREVDFVVIKNRKPVFAVECKTGETHLSHSIKYFKARTPIPYWFQVHKGLKDYGDEKKIRSRFALHNFLCRLLKNIMCKNKIILFKSFRKKPSLLLKNQILKEITYFLDAIILLLLK